MSDIIIGTLVGYFIVHVVCFFQTGWSSFFWLSKFFYYMESIQNGGVKAIPNCWKWWKYMSEQERRRMGDA